MLKPRLTIAYIIPLALLVLASACEAKKRNKGGPVLIPYDLPPPGPIPPETFCFERADADTKSATSVQLNIVGDSAFGEIKYAKSLNMPAGKFSGVIYGTALIIHYSFNGDSGPVTKNQEWVVLKDSLYVNEKTAIHDKTKIDSATLNENAFKCWLPKIPCK